MPIKATRVPVGTVAASLQPQADDDARPVQELLVKNPAGLNTPVYVGGPGVTTTNGYELAAGESVRIIPITGSVLYGVAAMATTVHVLQVGV